MGYKVVIGALFLGGLVGCAPIDRAEVIVSPSRPVLYTAPPRVYVAPAYTRSYYTYPYYRSYEPYYYPRRGFYRGHW